MNHPFQVFIFELFHKRIFTEALQCNVKIQIYRSD